MKTISGLKLRIAELQAQIAPLNTELEQCQRELRKSKSLEFIRVNKIKRGDVEMSDGDGKPYFSIVNLFANWLRIHSKKNWAEWNSRIYRVSDLLANRMPDMPAFVEDLEE